jgi:hypothetical protein
MKMTPSVLNSQEKSYEPRDALENAHNSSWRSNFYNGIFEVGHY